MDLQPIDLNALLTLLGEITLHTEVSETRNPDLIQIVLFIIYT